MLKLRMLSSVSLTTIATICVTSAVAQTAPPALLPAASGTYPTNSSSGNAVLRTGFRTADAKTAPQGSVSISYDMTNGTYRLSNDTRSFGPAQASAPTGGTANYFIGDSDYSKLLSVSQNPTGRYSYTSYALTYAPDTRGSLYDANLTEAFVFGAPTAAMSLPRTGAAYYTGLVDGWADSSRLVNSTGDLLANFATGEIATGLNLSNTTGFAARYDGRGVITAGTSNFSGSLFGSGNVNFVGQFNGGFYGPGAQEVGLTFALAGSRSTITGAFIGTGAPLPTSPPLPPVAPVAPINTSLQAPLLSERFAAIGGNLQVNLLGGTARQSVARTETPGAITIAYNATSNTYTLSDAYGSTAFGPSVVLAANGTTTTRTFNPNLSNSQSLVLSVAGSTNPRLALTYLSYGQWVKVRNISDSGAIDRSFIFGVETPAANLPRSGAALYDGVVAGRWIAGNSTYELADRSDGSLLVNFYTGEVRTRMSLVGTEISTNAVATLGRVDGYGSIAGGTPRFNGTMTGTDNAYSGNFQGAFYGPAYQEAGVSFALAGANGAGAVNGVLVANQVTPN